MALDTVRSELRRFIKSEKPEVLALRGDWGVGKTYTWEHVLREFNHKDIVNCSRYSYVSLFGVTSLESLKYRIFENSLSTSELGKVGDFDSKISGIYNLFGKKGRKIISGLGKAAWGDKVLPIQSLAYLWIKEFIICIDDLERISDGLNMKDVLGLISELSESKNCKVVIILNEKKVDSPELEIFKEKVIDVSLRFESSFQESFEIAFPSDCPNKEYLRKCCSKLNILNIRVLKRIERLYSLTTPLVMDLDEGVLSNLAHSVVLYTWSYYCSDKGVPDLDFLTNTDYRFLGAMSSEAEYSDEEKEWIALLRDYEYRDINAFDLEVVEMVKSGYVVQDRFQAKSKKLHDDLVRSKSAKDYTDAWDIFHKSFENNEEQVVSTLTQKFKEHIQNLEPGRLNSLIRLLRELKKDELATELIDYFIDFHKGNKNFFDIHELNVFGDYRDEELNEKFRIQFAKFSEGMNAVQALVSLIDRENSWSETEVEALCRVEVAEWYDIFKTAPSDKLEDYVKVALRFGKVSDSEGKYSSIYMKAKEALLRIASESDLNQLRVRKFGVIADKAKDEDKVEIDEKGEKN